MSNRIEIKAVPIPSIDKHTQRLSSFRISRNHACQPLMMLATIAIRHQTDTQSFWIGKSNISKRLTSGSFIPIMVKSSERKTISLEDVEEWNDNAPQINLTTPLTAIVAHDVKKQKKCLPQNLRSSKQRSSTKKLRLVYRKPPKLSIKPYVSKRTLGSRTFKFKHWYMQSHHVVTPSSPISRSLSNIIICKPVKSMPERQSPEWLNVFKNPVELKKLVKQKPDCVFETTRSGVTLLMKLAWIGDLVMVKFLIRKFKLELAEKDDHGWDIFRWAEYGQRFDVLFHLESLKST